MEGLYGERGGCICSPVEPIRGCNHVGLNTLVYKNSHFFGCMCAPICTEFGAHSCPLVMYDESCLFVTHQVTVFKLLRSFSLSNIASITELGVPLYHVL